MVSWDRLLVGRPFNLLFALALIFALAGCSGEPFKHVQVSGKVTYEDGTVIPVSVMELTFQPQAAAVDAQTHPRPGHADVDVATGEFARATTRKPGDGLVAGRHKVKITAYDDTQQISRAIPAEYTDISTTPIELDTGDQPWNITIKRPSD